MVQEGVMDTVTTAGAGAMVVSPWWLPYLHMAHDGVAYALPFLGAAWIVTQFYFKIKDRYTK
jgi:hypothetical protein